MSCQTVLPRVQVIPPVPQNVFFDEFQFACKRVKAVTAASGIAFSDFGRMHMGYRKPLAFRAQFIPAFATDDKKFARVLGVAGWRYVHGCGCGKPQFPEGISLQELEALTTKKFGRHKGPGKQIDRHRFVYENGGYMRVHAALAFRSWRLGQTSPEIAEALRMTPQQVRITLHRLNRIARGLGYETYDSGRRSESAYKGLATKAKNEQRAKWRADAVLYRQRKKARRCQPEK
jgi:hypothetical protein